MNKKYSPILLLLIALQYGCVTEEYIHAREAKDVTSIGDNRYMVNAFTTSASIGAGKKFCSDKGKSFEAERISPHSSMVIFRCE